MATTNTQSDRLYGVGSGIASRGKGNARLRLDSLGRVSAGTLVLLTAIVLVAGLAGCGASYVTPAAGIDLSSFTESDIQALMDREPVAPFPARVAVARVQASGYRSYSGEAYGYGSYSVVITRDIETDEHFAKIAAWPMVSHIATLNRLLIPRQLESDKELRLAAARLKADILLMYTIDTTFRIRDHDIGPLGIITLGFLPNQESMVTTTASAAIYDVRTGFVYGIAEATAKHKQMSSIWTSQDAIDETRKRTETDAFESLLDELAKTWTLIIIEHARKPAAG